MLLCGYIKFHWHFPYTNTSASRYLMHSPYAFTNRFVRSGIKSHLRYVNSKYTSNPAEVTYGELSTWEVAILRYTWVMRQSKTVVEISNGGKKLSNSPLPGACSFSLDFNLQATKKSAKGKVNHVTNTILTWPCRVTNVGIIYYEATTNRAIY